MRVLSSWKELNGYLPPAEREAERVSEPLPFAVAVTEAADVAALYRPRDRFAHKGDFGHGLLAAGSTGKAGAAVLAARAALRGGLGLLTVATTPDNRIVLQTAVPEAMVEAGPLPRRPFADYAAVGIGPGFGLDEASAARLGELLQRAGTASLPLVLDADALTLLAHRPAWLDGLSASGCVCTPHYGELRRLVGSWRSAAERIRKQQAFSDRYGTVVVGKGAYTLITFPATDPTATASALVAGRPAALLNPTGNAGMATAGSGDVLTGLILALLAQGYGPAEAAVAGVYLHGLAGDMAAVETGEAALMAGDIVAALPVALKAWAGGFSPASTDAASLPSGTAARRCGGPSGNAGGVLGQYRC
ncbi:MAG: NAD(P)H-hydrate dehydratase [Bacteroidales bacterium]|nr:NAD(P)H-hydrate dehydratase [Bacteroidales bacterium]